MGILAHSSISSLICSFVTLSSCLNCATVCASVSSDVSQHSPSRIHYLLNLLSGRQLESIISMAKVSLSNGTTRTRKSRSANMCVTCLPLFWALKSFGLLASHSHKMCTFAVSELSMLQAALHTVGPTVVIQTIFRPFGVMNAFGWIARDRCSHSVSVTAPFTMSLSLPVCLSLPLPHCALMSCCRNWRKFNSMLSCAGNGLAMVRTAASFSLLVLSKPRCNKSDLSISAQVYTLALFTADC